MKTILAAWIAAILLLLLASVVLAGPDEDARAALALAKIKAPAKAACSCGAPCPCDVGQCGDAGCPTAATACFVGHIAPGYGEGQFYLNTTNVAYYLVHLTDEQVDACKAWSMTDREVQVCGILGANHYLTVASIDNGTKADAPSASQQRQIDALPPGTVYQWRRPDGTLSEPKTKPGASPMTQPQRYDRPFMQFAPMMGRACVGSA